MPSSVSSLLRSAQSRRNKIQEQQDSVVAYEWAQSAKTYSDFLEYSKYLEERSTSTSDPSKLLSYQKQINNARSGYISNEIQRQSIAVIEGRQTNTDKYSKMVDLFYQAMDAGNYDLAQSLNLQLDNLSVSIQNEQQAAQQAASTMATNNVKSLTQLVDKFTKGEEMITLPDGRILKPLSMLNGEVTANGETSFGYFQEVKDTINALQETIAAAYAGASTQEAVDAIESKYGSILTGEKEYKTAAGNLTYADIELGYRSALAGNPLFSPAASRDETTGALTYKLAKNKVDDFVWVRNDDGTYQAVETRAKVLDKQQSLDSRITNEGEFISETGSGKGNINRMSGTTQIKTDDSQTIKNRLAAQGITATQGDNGTLNLVLPNGEQYQGTINPDGSIRYFGKPGQFSGGQAGLYQIDVLNGSVREVSPDESSIFGTKSVFGGQISKASDAGKNIIASLAGITASPKELFSPLAKITNVQNDFTGRGAPATGSNLQGSTNILENAAQTRAAAIKAASEANKLQPSTVFNLNQTPVQQFAQNGAPIKQLTVAKPVAAPQVSVAAPQPTPKVGSVNVAQNVSRVTGVTALPAQPKVVVR